MYLSVICMLGREVIKVQRTTLFLTPPVGWCRPSIRLNLGWSLRFGVDQKRRHLWEGWWKQRDG